MFDKSRLPPLIQQTNRYTAALRKLLSIKGEAHQVSFGVHLEDERPEHSFIKGEVRFAQWNSATGDATHRPLIGVRNPANSGVVAIVTDIFIEATTAFLVSLEMSANILSISSSAMFGTDTRWARGSGVLGLTTVQGFASTPSGGTAGHLFTALTAPANAVLDIVGRSGRVHPLVVGPGADAYVFGPLGAITLAATFVGYERTLESGELQA